MPSAEATAKTFQRKTEEIEAEKNRRKFEREQRKKDRETYHRRQQQEKLVAPILLILTFIVSLLIYVL